MEDGDRGFPVFLAGKFIGNSKKQLIDTILKRKIMPAEAVEQAVQRAKQLTSWMSSFIQLCLIVRKFDFFHALFFGHPHYSGWRPASLALHRPLAPLMSQELTWCGALRNKAQFFNAHTRMAHFTCCYRTHWLHCCDILYYLLNDSNNYWQTNLKVKPVNNNW